MEKDTRFIDEEEFNAAPQEDDGGNGGKGGGKKTALIIVALLLGFAILGAAVYAAVNLVFMPDNKNFIVKSSEPSVPTISEEPSLTPMPTGATIPTEAPTEAPTESEYALMADKYMEDMSDYEKLCQLFIVTPEVLTATQDDSDDSEAVTVAGEMTEKSLEEYPVGGLIYFADNLEDADQIRSMVRNTQKYTKTPLFISVEEEGGDVAQVAQKLGTKKFYPIFNYKDYGADIAHDVAGVNAFNIRRFGFNMDYAPVADVLTNPNNTAIGKRAYSDDYEQAAELVAAAVKGYDEGEVVTVLKHFPGHGSTDEDSHEEFAHVKTSVEALKSGELLPFKSGIDAGADMVMVGHLIVDELDPEKPATLSSKVVPELLRKELGYDGIVISDSMSAPSVDADYGAIVKGLFAADIDIILQPDNLEKYVEAMENALDSGDITQEQIDAKVRKILTLKFKQGIIKPIEVEIPTEVATETATEIAPVSGSTRMPSEVPAATAATEIAAETTVVDAPTEKPSVAA